MHTIVFSVLALAPIAACFLALAIGYLLSFAVSSACERTAVAPSSVDTSAIDAEWCVMLDCADLCDSLETFDADRERTSRRVSFLAGCRDAIAFARMRRLSRQGSASIDEGNVATVESPCKVPDWDVTDYALSALGTLAMAYDDAAEHARVTIADMDRYYVRLGLFADSDPYDGSEEPTIIIRRAALVA